MEITISKNYNVKRLQYWLTYELSSSILLLLNLFYGVTIILAIIAAVAFTPFMLKILFQEKRFGWITFFCVLVMIPLVLVYLFFYESKLFMVWKYIPLAAFYFYCFILRIAISDWADGIVKRK